MKKWIGTIGVCILGYGAMTAVGYFGGTLIGKIINRIWEND